MESSTGPDDDGASTDAANAVASDGATADQARGTVVTDMATSAPPRFPKFGTYDGLTPLHLSQFAIETNVSRIAQQIALGREPTYD